MANPLAAFPAATMLLTMLGATALAQPVAPTDPLPGQAGLTYADLIENIAPGIVFDGNGYSGGRLPDIRHLGGWDDDGIELAATGSLRITARPVGSRLAALLDFDTAGNDVTDLAILALFDPAAGPRLLDAVNASFDRWTAFRDPAVLPLGDGADLLLTQSTHFNSEQAYAISALTLVRHDRLELIDTVAMLSESNCAYDLSQSLEVTSSAALPFADIVAVVTEQTTIPPEACPGLVALVEGSRTIAVTYRWDAGAQRYAPDSDAFGILARENETRF